MNTQFNSFVLVPLLLAPSLAATVIQFDNSSATFVLTGGRGGPDHFLDPTRSPSEQITFGSFARGITYVVVDGGGSETPNADSFGTGSNIRIARSTSPTSIPNMSGQVFQFFAARTFSLSATIGSGLNYQDGAAAALFYVGGGRIHDPLLGATPITAFRLDLPTGTHFGWVQWEFRSGPFDGGFPGQTVPMYQPIRWAYETEPNIPITVPAPVSTVALLALACVTLRRRRSS